MHHFIR